MTIRIGIGTPSSHNRPYFMINSYPLYRKLVVGKLRGRRNLFGSPR